MRTGARRESPGGCDLHDHVAWVFDDDAEWRAAATTFVAEGIARGERVYYGASGAVAARRDDLAELPDRDALIASNALQIFDAGVIARASYPQRETLIRSAIDQALADGCPGVRFAVDSTNVAPGGNWDVQAGWERRSDRMCQSLALTALCGVNRSVVGDDDVARVACVHPATGGSGEPGTFSLFAVDGGLALSGEIDAAVAGDLASALAHDEPSPGESVLDLSRLDFIDGRGMASIAARADRVAAAGGLLLITGASPMAHRIWELCGFEHRQGVHMAEGLPT